MIYRLIALIWGAVALLSASAHAAALKVEQVTENVYAIVGPFEQRNARNLANNSTHGFVVTSEGVLLVDPGGSYKGAAAIEKAIRTITDKPVKIVINSGGLINIAVELEPQGYRRREAMRRVNAIRNCLRDIFDRAASSGTTPDEAALALAQEYIGRARAEVKDPR